MGELIPAATVIPLRDTPQPGGGTALEVLMLRKNSKIAFGGMWVFPGGRVDPEDDDPADPGDDEAAARRAAVREAFEEADLLIEPGGLEVFSHWTPPEVSMNSNKRFSTWFFVGRAPVGEDGEVTIDMGEIHEDEWVQPAEMLARRDSGTIQLVPPTIVTLHDLARFSTVDQVLEACAARQPFRYTTKIVAEGDTMVALWTGDAGYDNEDLSTPGPRHRLTMGEGPWSFEDDVVMDSR